MPQRLEIPKRIYQLEEEKKIYTEVKEKHLIKADTFDTVETLHFCLKRFSDITRYRIFEFPGNCLNYKPNKPDVTEY